MIRKLETDERPGTPPDGFAWVQLGEVFDVPRDPDGRFPELAWKTSSGGSCFVSARRWVLAKVVP